MFNFDLFSIEFWGFNDEMELSILRIGTSAWSGSLFQIYWDRTDLRKSHIDILYTEQLIRVWREKKIQDK